MPARRAAPIDPGKHKAILDGMEIVRISVGSLSGRALDRPQLESRSEKCAVSVKERSELSAGVSGVSVVRHSYDLTVNDQDAEGAGKLMTLAVAFRIEYASQTAVAKRFVAVFSKTSLHLQVAPFARPLARDHCLRIGVPYLIMPSPVIPAFRGRGPTPSRSGFPPSRE